MEPGVLTAVFDRLLAELLAHSRVCYGDRLVALAVFGSVGRGRFHAESDIDLLVVADPLPDGRLSRVAEFDAGVERALEGALVRAREQGVATRLSPVLKTRAEVEAGSPLLLDMVEDARILYDGGGFLAGRLERLRRRLAELGSQRIWRGNAWYWVLKPDLEPGETFEL